MVDLVIALASLATYLFVGFRFVAPRYITRGMERHIELWPRLCDPDELARERREKSYEAVVIVPVWPIYVVGRMLSGGLFRRAPLTDVEQAQKIREQQNYIDRLERETGIR